MLTSQRKKPQADRRTAPRRPALAVLGGAGAMGRAVVHDLTRQGFPVRVIEADAPAGERVARRYGHGRAEVVVADAGDPSALAARLRGLAAVVNCAPYTLNLRVMEAALEARCHYLDLGGLFHTTRLQLPHDREFRRRGLLAVLGMGSAPGIVNVMARAAAERLKRVHVLGIYNGGRDDTPRSTPLHFGFAPATVLDEFTLAPMVYENGRYRARPPLSGAEDYAFDVGVQRVHYALHSEVATLPLSFADRGLRSCWFKIAYDPQLVERLELLIDLGLADRRRGPRGVAPREVLLDCLRALPAGPAAVDDYDCLVVEAAGEDRQGPVRLRYDLTARAQRRPPLSAVARDTGFPPAIVARLLLDGAIRERGVLPPERCVPVRPFFAALEARGLSARVSHTRPL